MTAGPVTPTAARQWRTWRWAGLALVVIALIALASAWLTAPRPGGRMDPESTSSDGARALIALLRDQGVEVVVADTASEARQAVRDGSLLLVAQTGYTAAPELLRPLADAPGDLLLIEPAARTREALAPELRRAPAIGLSGAPDCDLPEADRAGTVSLGTPDAYAATDDTTHITSCYGGALVRYHAGGRQITVVGSADFLTNSTLLQEGNAALAMNLAGAQPRLIWYAPQHPDGETSPGASISDLVPEQVSWIVWQAWLAVGLIALWKVRRMGPLVTEDLPVVVRASETVEGRGRLYRSRRARDRAAEALRTATLQRLSPRLGLGANAQPPAIIATIMARSGGQLTDPQALQHSLFGPTPSTDDDLVQLAHALDDIERQVAHS
ncbi:DUF4350 domain-containing protein [Mycolicibacterium komossense]|uniref:DUF4350 domain-containing protein n=1 Tax=Mycolicibacterium komossense TaxID=1779 RepID=A0ABT3C8R3_9MYCO|nr:DUF4350 domain-containing protein [Mycolicibacterium komossense]MCV7225865.1 DUF4350 domain-containing protein [Mycolicibacterium komossense]